MHACNKHLQPKVTAVNETSRFLGAFFLVEVTNSIISNYVLDGGECTKAEKRTGKAVGTG
jgi:hypothetical protein